MKEIIEWLFDDPDRAGLFLMCVVVGLTGIGVWFGRKRLAVTIPLALLLLILAAIAIPGALPAHNEARRAACINNLRLVDTAKAQWARAEHKLSTDVPTEEYLIGTNKFLPFKPVCPRGGTYTFGVVNQNPTCSLAAQGHKLD